MFIYFVANIILGVGGYLIQHYVIKLVSDWWFSLGTPVSTTNKTDHHDITEILLKLVLNTITLTLTHKEPTI